MVAISQAWYNGSYTTAAKPIKSLELHYTLTKTRKIQKNTGKMTEWSPIRSVIITTLYSDPVFNKGSYTMAVKPIKTVELHYTMIQFFIIYRIQRCAKIAFKLHCSRSPKLTTNNITQHSSCTSLQLITSSDLFLLNINFTFGLFFFSCL